MRLIRRCFTVCMLVSALLCFALPCMSAAPVEQVPTGYKVVRTEKLDELKSNNDKLVLKLAELEQKLALLKMPSTELVEQLATAKNELELCKQELKNAKNSLASAKSLQEQTLASLQSLESKLDAERKQQANREKRLRRQRDTWLFVAGAALVYGVTK